MVYIKLVKHGGDGERILECKYVERFLRSPDSIPPINENAIQAWNDHPFAKFVDYFPEELWLMDGKDPRKFQQVMLRGCGVIVMSETGKTIDTWDVPIPKIELGLPAGSDHYPFKPTGMVIQEQDQETTSDD